MMLVVHYWDLEKCVIGTTQRPSFLPSSLLRVSLERPIDSWLVTSSCVCLRTVCGLSPLKTEFLVDFLGPVQREGRRCHGERSDLFVVESLGTVVPACSSEPCKSAGPALVPGRQLFLISVPCYYSSGCWEGIQVCRPVKAE